MSDDYQIEIPPSFFALYTDARQRLREPIGIVRARYELCEDLATHLIEQAQLLHHVAVPSEDEILRHQEVRQDGNPAAGPHRGEHAERGVYRHARLQADAPSIASPAREGP